MAYKTVLNVTLIHDEKLPLDRMSLADIGQAIDEGNFSGLRVVGRYGVNEHAPVAEADLPKELDGIGSSTALYRGDPDSDAAPKP